jgi:hypothetical protein
MSAAKRLQLAALRVLSDACKDLEIVLLRHELSPDPSAS